MDVREQPGRVVLAARGGASDGHHPTRLFLRGRSGRQGALICIIAEYLGVEAFAAYLTQIYPSKGAGERGAWFRDSEGNLLGIGQPVRSSD